MPEKQTIVHQVMFVAFMLLMTLCAIISQQYVKIDQLSADNQIQKVEYEKLKQNSQRYFVTTVAELAQRQSTITRLSTELKGAQTQLHVATRKLTKFKHSPRKVVHRHNRSKC